MWRSRQTHARGQRSLVGFRGRWGSCSWKLEAGSQPPPSQVLACGVVGSHPGALSSCCVCASFFRAPHRCYENLRSPAGKVTSARAASPRPRLGPCSGWGGLPSAKLATHIASLSLPFLSPPSSFPTSLHPGAGSLILSLLPRVLPSLSCQRDVGESSDSGEDLGFFLHF